jgi:hypothetical protein
MNDDVITLTTIKAPEPPITLSQEESELLEKYAGLAMQAIIGNIETLESNEDYNHDAVATDAFEFAFAMMRKRYEHNR